MSPAPESSTPEVPAAPPQVASWRSRPPALPHSHPDRRGTGCRSFHSRARRRDAACVARAPGGDGVVRSCTGLHKGLLTANALGGNLRWPGTGLTGTEAARWAVHECTAGRACLLTRGRAMSAPARWNGRTPARRSTMLSGRLSLQRLEDPSNDQIIAPFPERRKSQDVYLALRPFHSLC
jgi:hypothetical protein